MTSSVATFEDEVIFEMNLEEDVAAELEDFVFTARLGLIEEAQAAIDHILYRHLDVFPVTAEVCSFLLEQKAHNEVDKILEKLKNDRIVFTTPQERDFIKTIHEVNRELSFPNHQLRRWNLFNILDDVDFEDPVQVHRAELICFASRERAAEWPEVAYYHLVHFYHLLDRELNAEATRTFVIACQAAACSGHQGQERHVHMMYRALMKHLQVSDLKQAQNRSKAEIDSLLCLLSAKSEMIKFLTDFPQHMYQLQTVHEELGEVLQTLFRETSVPSSRSIFAQTWQELNPSRSRLVESHQSTAFRPRTLIPDHKTTIHDKSSIQHHLDQADSTTVPARDISRRMPTEEIKSLTITTQRFSCDFVDCVDDKGRQRAFSGKADLKRHVVALHGRPYIDCEQQNCERKGDNGFCRKEHYRKHLRDEHGLKRDVLFRQGETFSQARKDDLISPRFQNEDQKLSSSQDLQSGQSVGPRVGMNNLAGALRDQGKYEEAEQMHREELLVRQKALGMENPSTLTSMNNLAVVLRDGSKYEEAEQIHREVLMVRRKVLGMEHPSTLTSMGNLAEVLSDQGKYEEAEQMHREALGVAQKVLGMEHPSTLTSMGNLAEVLRDEGKYEEAEQMHREELVVRLKVLGMENPSTLTSMNNLAVVLSDQGKYEEAEQMHREALGVTQKALGMEHPSTLTNMCNLAEVLRDQGKYEEAEQMHREVLGVRQKVLGMEHPSTLTSMNNLAEVLRDQGKYEEAEQIHREVLGVRLKVLGMENPSTLTSMGNLDLVLKDQGKYEEAEQMHREALGVAQKVLEMEHPSTLASMDNLAEALGDQGKYEEAEQMHREELGVRQKALGMEHPSTLTSMNNLAMVLRDQGKYEEAEQMHREVLGVRLKVLGMEHPSTLTSMNNLDLVLKDQGKYEEAEQMHQEALEVTQKMLGMEQSPTLNNPYYTAEPSRQSSNRASYYPTSRSHIAPFAPETEAKILSEKQEHVAATSTMQQLHYPSMYQTPQSNSPASVTSPQPHGHGRSLFLQQSSGMAQPMSPYSPSPINQMDYSSASLLTEPEQKTPMAKYEHGRSPHEIPSPVLEGSENRSARSVQGDERPAYSRIAKWVRRQLAPGGFPGRPQKPAHGRNRQKHDVRDRRFNERSLDVP